MEKYSNIYRIDSSRHPKQDYSWNGYYFVTIKTKCDIDVFGKIINNKIILSDNGIIAQEIWKQIPRQFPYVKLDKFIFMPDHMHGIVVIDKSDHKFAANLKKNKSKNGKAEEDIPDGKENIKGRDAIYRVSCMFGM